MFGAASSIQTLTESPPQAKILPPAGGKNVDSGRSAVSGRNLLLPSAGLTKQIMARRLGLSGIYGSYSVLLY